MFSVIGSVIADLTIHTSKEFRLIGERLSFPFDSKINIEKIRFGIGGSGHNLSVALASLGEKAYIFAKVGYDSNGSLALRSLKKNRVSLKEVKRTNADLTGFSLIFLYGGEKTIITYRGANNLVGPEDVNEKLIERSDCFVFTSMISEKNLQFLRKAVDIAKSAGVTVVANPSSSMVNYRRKELLQLLSEADLLILNKKEAKQLSKADSVKKSLAVLRRKVSKIVITLGKEGSLVWDGSLRRVKAYPVKVVDTTGAGDSFSAGVLHALKKGYSLVEAAKFGSAVSAIVISEGKRRMPKEDEVIDFLRKRGENFV